MTVEFLTIAASGIVSAVTALGGVVLGSQLLIGRERDADRVARCRESADALLGSLRTLRDIVEQAQGTSVSPPGIPRLACLRSRCALACNRGDPPSHRLGALIGRSGNGR
jgi:hypothetical protein